jgi:hypothetical protein
MNYPTILPFELGETVKGTDTDGNIITPEWAGKVHVLSDSQVSAARLAPRRTGRQLLGIPVLNNSGITLLGKRLVRLKRAGGLTDLARADGYSATLNAVGLVFVDEYLASTGVADKFYFWGIVSGAITTLTPTVDADFNGQIGIGALLVAATGATTQTSSSGRVASITIANATDAAGAQAGAAGVVARALSARTTANTNADLLVLAMLRY